MNEKRFIFIVAAVLFAVCIFAAYRIGKSGANSTNGDGGGASSVAGRIDDSTRKLEAVRRELGAIESGIERSLEISRGTTDKIERLRIIVEALENCHLDVRRVHSSIDGGDFVAGELNE